MYVTRFSTLIAMLLSASVGLPDEVQLFNGKDLDGWVAAGVKEFVKDGRTLPVWSVKNGNLVCTGKGFGFLRYDRRTFADFVFHVEFRMAPGCNSGLGIRTRSFDLARSRATRPSFYGYEIQLFDDAGKPPTVHTSGSLYRYVAPRKNAILPAGQWNSIDIECAGPRIKVTLNGELIVDLDQQTIPELRQKPLQGCVCLQNHGGNIEFRSLRIREINAPGTKVGKESRPGSKKGANLMKARCHFPFAMLASVAFAADMTKIRLANDSRTVCRPTAECGSCNCLLVRFSSVKLPCPNLARG